jgi:hypothetical protein
MPIDRTAYNALVDDDGSGGVGSILNKNLLKTVLLDPIDLELSHGGGGAVDIRSYGAVCDGVANVATAIAAALAAGHKRLYLPAQSRWIPAADTTPANVEIIGEDWTTVIVESSSPDTAYVYIGARSVLQNVAVFDKWGAENPGVLKPAGPPNAPRPIRKITNLRSTEINSSHWSYMSETVMSGEAGVDQPAVSIAELGVGDGLFLAAGEEAVALRIYANYAEPTHGAKAVLLQAYGQGAALHMRGEVGSNPADGYMFLEPFANAKALNINPKIATTTDLQIASGYKTSGQMINLFHSDTVFAGAGLSMTFGTAPGSFTGAFLDFLNAGVHKWVVDASGTLTTGIIPSAALSGALPAISGASLTALNASNLASGTVPDARFPATLPAMSGVNLTALNASNLASGTVPLGRLSGLTNTEIDAAAAIAWSKVSKSGASLADLATRSASDLSSGTLPDARFPATLPAASGVNLTALNATNLGSGTVPDARFPATLPAMSGVNLTALNASNLASGSVPLARLANGTTTVVNSTATGAQNNWAPGLAGDTVINWSGATALTVTGFAGGVSGQMVTFRNTGTALATFSHNSGSSSAGNKLFNIATGAGTPVAPGGHITYQYDGTQWQAISHDQGAWITPAYAAGDFTGNGSMTWTVDAGDVADCAYRLQGRTMTVTIRLAPTTVGGTLNSTLQVGNGAWGGFTAALGVNNALGYCNDNGAVKAGNLAVVGGGTVIAIQIAAGGNWTASTNSTYIYGTITFPVS